MAKALIRGLPYPQHSQLHPKDNPVRLGLIPIERHPGMEIAMSGLSFPISSRPGYVLYTPSQIPILTPLLQNFPFSLPQPGLSSICTWRASLTTPILNEAPGLLSLKALSQLFFFFCHISTVSSPLTSCLVPVLGALDSIHACHGQQVSMLLVDPSLLKIWPLRLYVTLASGLCSASVTIILLILTRKRARFMSSFVIVNISRSNEPSPSLDHLGAGLHTTLAARG